jgi:polyphenol oxidase
MSAPSFLQAASLTRAGLRHAFFTRQGGVSTGIYASLNGGVGSRDAPAAVAENRARMAGVVGVKPERFLVPFQIHSAEAVVVSTPWPADARPRVDGIVTATPGLALGVTGADCGMILFADTRAGVIGAAHAGWGGALNGVLEATLVAMEKTGARRADTLTALGPMIGPQSYEVGPEYRARFLAASAEHTRFFTRSVKPEHFMFDLPGFIEMRLERAGVAGFENLGLDTYADDTRFFSYRRSVHRKEADYGRLVAALALE